MSLDSERYEAYEVESSMARAIAFELVGQVTHNPDEPRDEDYGDVLVVYKDGSIWRYHGVLRSTFDAIRSANSVGRAINALLKQRGAKREVKG
jgi:KTSC domain